MTAPRQVEEQCAGGDFFAFRCLSNKCRGCGWGGEQKRVIQTTPSDEIAGFWTPLETWSAFLAGFRGFDRKTAQRAP